MRKQPTSASRQRQRTERWSAALLAGGFVLLAASWIMEGTFAFQTADRSVQFMGLPVDALGKTIIAVVTGFTGFAGAAVTAWLFRQEGAKAKKQARLALAVTVACVAMSVFFLASYFANAQRVVEAPRIAASAEYGVALETLRSGAARLTGEPMGYEEEAIVRTAMDTARDTVRRGTPPTGSEGPNMRGFLWALIVHMVASLGAAAFRLPDTKKRTVKTARRAASVTPFRRAVS